MKFMVKMLFLVFVAGGSSAAGSFVFTTTSRPSFKVAALVTNGTLRVVTDDPQGEISEIRYAIDSNGNGDFSDETAVPYSGPVVINTLNLMAGKYAWKAAAVNAGGQTAIDTNYVEHIRLTMPPVVYAVEGQKTEIYFNNIMNSVQKDASEFDVVITAGALASETNEKCWFLTPQLGNAGDYELTVSVRDDQNRLLATTTSTLHVASSSAGSTEDVTLLVVGDSLTAAGIYPARLAERLNQAGNPTWEMQGLQAAPNGAFHEGYGGNTWKRFVAGDPAYPTYSPFFYSQLDFGRYLTENEAGKKPDIITVNLGVNDNFGVSASEPTLEAINASIDTMFLWATQLIDEFRSVCPHAEIGIGITTTANSRPSAFQANYGSAERAWRWKHVVRVVDERIIAEYRDREAEKIYLIPSHLGLDDYDGFPSGNAVHPNTLGYNQMGDSFYAWLKWRLEEREGNNPERVATFQEGIGGYAGTQDNTLYSGANVGMNAGAGTALTAKSDRRGILKFDLSSLPAYASIDSATIKLYQYNATQPAYDLTMYQIADANATWMEGAGAFSAALVGESTWRHIYYNYASSTNWAGSQGLSTAGTDYITPALDVVSHPENTAGWLEFDIPTALIEQWATGINAGVMVTNPNDGAVLASSEYGGATEANWVYRPILTVNYTVAP